MEADLEHDLTRNVKAWLDDEGMSLEMRVAREFQQRRFRVVQSEYFRDQDSQVLREIDVSALLIEPLRPFTLHIGALVECKVSLKKPWVAFVTPRPRLSPVAAVAQRLATPLGEQWLDRLSKDTTVQGLPLMSQRPQSGYGLATAFIDRQDPNRKDYAYEAVMKAMKAASASAGGSRYQKEHLCGVYFPVVVLGGRLFEASLDGARETVVAEVARSQLITRQSLAGMPHTIVDVVTEDGLPAYVDDFRATVEGMLAKKDQLYSVKPTSS
jgi:hypothetical protein